MNKNKVADIFAVLAVVLLAVQALLFLVSWLVAAVIPEANVHSLLSNEGIRWFFGSFVDNIASPLLVWLLVIAMAWGMIKESHLLKDIRRLSALPYRPKFAFQFVTFELILFVVVIILTALVPHAPLLSVTGQLFPSSFSRSLIPMIAFCLIVMGATYGLLSGKMKTVYDVFIPLSRGISQMAPVICIYVLAAELYYLINYVFGAYFMAG